MGKGFIYVVSTLRSGYRQEHKCNVPTDWTDPIYFGPCKIPMRKKMRSGDWIFGISPAILSKRRIVFIAQIDERITFAKAYNRLHQLRHNSPKGPIHVRPVNKQGPFPMNCYEHIKGTMHEFTWKSDLATPELDAFFICHKSDGFIGKWLGVEGPEIDDGILAFLKTCSVHGKTGLLCETNESATEKNPVCHGRLYRGLHLETASPEKLIELCRQKTPLESQYPEKTDESQKPISDRRKQHNKIRKGCC